MEKLHWFYIECPDGSKKFEQHPENWADGGSKAAVVRIEKPGHVRKLDKVSKKASKFLRKLRRGIEQAAKGEVEDLGTFRERA
jgi:hypothetical protein